MKNLIGLFIFAGAALAQSDSFDTQYPASQRIQISESCPKIAKWLSQMLSTGPHWMLLAYSPDLGTLSFRVISSDKLSKAQTRAYLADPKAKNVRIDGLVLTLRSLVSSNLNFDDGKQSSGESCAIAAGFKFLAKDDKAPLSSGKMEIELLQTVKNRYQLHGLDY